MIPSANTSCCSWINSTVQAAAEHWSADHTPAGPISSSTAAAAPVHSNYNRNQILDWENAMLLAATTSQHPTNDHSSSTSVYIDHLAEYKPSIINNLMHADAIMTAHLSSHSRQYDSLLSQNSLNSSSNVNPAEITWPGLLNTVCSGNSIPVSGGQHVNSLVQASPGDLIGSYESLYGAATATIGGYSSTMLRAAAGGSTAYAGDLLGSSRSSSYGLSSFDQRRLEDILMKRELYPTQDFNSIRLGLNLGGRTYFSAADDFAVGGFGKRMRPTPAGCIMQPPPLCQAEGCKADLSMAKHYHRRHKVCEYHSKASTVHIGEQTQRFCQQCSRFHVLSEFDDGKRSCRKRLADHNRRRRKPQPAPPLPMDVGPPAAAAAASNDESTDSQDAPAATGGDGQLDVNGVASGKCSPSQAEAGEDEPPVPSVRSTNEATNSNKAKVQDHDLVEKNDPQDAPTGGIKEEIKIAIGNASDRPPTAGINKLAAGLSLGTKETHDVRTAAGVNQGVVESSGARYNPAPTTKSSTMMSWLQVASQGPKNNVPAMPYNSIKVDRTLSGASSDYQSQFNVAASLSTERAKATSIADDKSHSSSSWMKVKGSMVEPDHGVLVNARHRVKPSGGHDLLPSVGGGHERDVFNGSKHSTVATSLGALAFLDHPLDGAPFRKAEQTIPFSSRGQQQQQQSNQLSSPLNGTHSSTSIFDCHNHWI